jgi:hypothetical protein
MASRVYRPLKVITFNVNSFWKRRCELSKRLQDLHSINVALLSVTYLKPHKRFFIPNYYIYLTDRFPGRKGIPNNHADLR